MYIVKAITTIYCVCEKDKHKNYWRRGGLTGSYKATSNKLYSERCKYGYAKAKADLTGLLSLCHDINDMIEY